jgi:diketogulonate reductase-like aldo/keto reductase
MKSVTLSTGETIPALGLGTWHMGERTREASAEVKALQRGIDLGMTLIDTAEMYGEGGAESVVGQAIKGRRDGVYLVSKVYPHNASCRGVEEACARSLKRLGTDRIDLYLLHWRGSHPLEETVAGFERLKQQGRIRAWGVSNFDVDDMAELAGVTNGGHCLSNQVLYHLGERGIEWNLLQDCSKREVMVMAYSPLGQGPILRDPALGTIAKKHAVTPAAVALAFVLRQPGVVAIPKAVRLDHVDANAAAANLVLDADDLARLDAAFPPPQRARPLAML